MKVKANTEDLATLSNLFHRLETVISAINLSDEGIRYYARFVLQSRTNQMLQKSEQDKYLYIIAFSIHQYYKLQDGLLDTLTQVVQQHAPLDFLQEKEQKHLFDACKFKVSLYKTLFFKAGTLNLKYSHKYVSWMNT